MKLGFRRTMNYTGKIYHSATVMWTREKPTLQLDFETVQL